MYLGMSQDEANETGFRGTNEGSKLSARSDLWSDGDLENNIAFNTSGFNALPSGLVNNEGTCVNEYGYTNFWTKTEFDNDNDSELNLVRQNTESHRGTVG